MRQFIMSEINDAWILAAQKEVNQQLSIWSEQGQSIKDILYGEKYF